MEETDLYEVRKIYFQKRTDPSIMISCATTSTHTNGITIVGVSVVDKRQQEEQKEQRKRKKKCSVVSNLVKVQPKISSEKSKPVKNANLKNQKFPKVNVCF